MLFATAIFVTEMQQEETKMAVSSDGTSFYFFDFDDNIIFLSTLIFILNKKTKEPKRLTTGEFANIHPQLGHRGKYQNYDVFDETVDSKKYGRLHGSFNNFLDISEEELKSGQKQHFVLDVEKAIETADQKSWQAPSWDLFVYACKQQRPISIITARGHSPETLKAGVRVLVDKGLLLQEPNYLTVFPVANDDVCRELCSEQPNVPDLKRNTPALKRIAIRKSVDKAIEKYGSEPDHRFGMSDDDPQNVDLIIKAMCDCKQKYPDKRFFVINTHAGEMVKLEVFPFNFPVTDKKEIVSQDPLK
jgi:hypothetical protein